MKERFEGANSRHLLAAIQRQEFAKNDAALAEALIAAGELVEFRPGEDFILQDGTDIDVYFLVAGVAAVIVNGYQVGERRAGQHVGEMAAIEPALPRSATLRVLEHVVALKVSSDGFMSVGETFGSIWLPIARELSRRLYARNASIPLPNKSPKLFIMSSSEALPVARAIETGLAKDVFVSVWNEGTFFAGGYTLEALEKKVTESDFALAVAEPDDITVATKRGTVTLTMRDNVLFELGLFMGTLTRYRTILVHPKVKELHIPSDLQGLTLIPYEAGDATTLDKRLEPVCAKMREVFKLGVRTFSPK